MDFTLNEEQVAIRDACRDFAEQEIRPRAEEMDCTGNFPYDLIRKMGELGLLGLPFPEEYGGAGADFLSYCLAIEEISRGDVSVGITMEAHTSLGASPFYLFGSKAQKEHYLTPLARGEQLWAFGLTEPEAGSDSGGTQTRAVLRDGNWHINGSKSFITNAGTDMSGGVTITAVTGRRSDGHNEITNIIVPRDTAGYIIGNPYKKWAGRPLIHAHSPSKIAPFQQKISWVSLGMVLSSSCRYLMPDASLLPRFPLDLPRPVLTKLLVMRKFVSSLANRSAHSRPRSSNLPIWIQT